MNRRRPPPDLNHAVSTQLLHPSAAILTSMKSARPDRRLGVGSASGAKAAADAIRSIGVTGVTYYRSRNEYGGLKSDQVKRLKDLETRTLRFAKRCRI